MPFCDQCGVEIRKDAKYCWNCGHAITLPSQAPTPHTEGPAASEHRSGKWASVIHSLCDTQDSSSAFGAEEVAANKGMAILCYLSILIAFPLALKRSSPYIRFHINQGLILLISATACMLVRSIVLEALSMLHIPIFFLILANLPFYFCLACILFFDLFGLYYTAAGKSKMVPLIGRLVIFPPEAI